MGLFGGGPDTTPDWVDIPKYAPQAPMPLQGAAKGYGGLLQNFVGQGNPYAGITSAQVSPLSQRAIEAYQYQDPAIQARNYFTGITRGDYLGLNPQMQQAVMDPAMASVASRFAAAGRYGSPASQQSMAEAGMRALMPYYDAERQRQGQAAAMLPQIQTGLAGQLQAGGALQTAQALGAPELQYLQQMQPFFTQWGGSTPAAPMTGSSALGGALGGAMAGGSMFGPWGALGGGLLGALA